MSMKKPGKQDVQRMYLTSMSQRSQDGQTHRTLRSIANRIKSKDEGVGMSRELICKPLSIRLVRLPPNILLESNKKLDENTKICKQCETLETKSQLCGNRSNSPKITNEDRSNGNDTDDEDMSKRRYKNNSDIWKFRRKRVLDDSDEEGRNLYEKRAKRSTESGNDEEVEKNTQQTFKEVRIVLTRVEETKLSPSIKKNLVPRVSLVKLKALKNHVKKKSRKNSASENENNSNSSEREYSPKEQSSEIEDNNNVNINDRSDGDATWVRTPVKKSLPKGNMLKIWRNAFCSDKTTDRSPSNTSDLSSNFANSPSVPNVKKSIAQVFPRLLSAVIEASKHTVISGSEQSAQTSEDEEKAASSRRSSESSKDEEEPTLQIVTSPLENAIPTENEEEENGKEKERENEETESAEVQASKSTTECIFSNATETDTETTGHQTENNKSTNLEEKSKHLPSDSRQIQESEENREMPLKEKISTNNSQSTLPTNRPKPPPIQQVSPKKNKLRIYRCMICKTSFKGYQALQTHLMESHAPPKVDSAKAISPTETASTNQSVRTAEISGTSLEEQKECDTALNEQQKLTEEISPDNQKEGKETGRTEPCERPLTIGQPEETRKEETKVSPRVRLICTLCNAIFFDGTALDKHVEYHKHIRRTRPQYICVDITAIKRVVICSICANVYDSVKDFEEHWPRHGAIHEDFVCTDCDKRLDNLESFIEHTAEHQADGTRQNDKFFSCKVMYCEIKRSEAAPTIRNEQPVVDRINSNSGTPETSESEETSKEIINPDAKEVEATRTNDEIHEPLSADSNKQSAKTSDIEIILEEEAKNEDETEEIMIIEEKKNPKATDKTTVPIEASETSVIKESKKVPMIRVKSLAELQGKPRTATPTMTKKMVHLCSTCGLVFNSIEKLTEHQVSHENSEESESSTSSTTTAVAIGSNSTTKPNDITTRNIQPRNNITTTAVNSSGPNIIGTSISRPFGQYVIAPIRFPELPTTPLNVPSTLPVPSQPRNPTPMHIPPACRVGNPVVASSTSQYNYSQQNRPCYTGRRMSEFLPVLPAPTPLVGRQSEALPKNALSRANRSNATTTAAIDLSNKYVCPVCPNFQCNTLPEIIKHTSSAQHESQRQTQLRGQMVMENVTGIYPHPWTTTTSTPLTMASANPSNAGTSSVTFPHGTSTFNNGSLIAHVSNLIPTNQNTMVVPQIGQQTRLYGLRMQNEDTRQRQQEQQGTTSNLVNHFSTNTTGKSVIYVCDYCPSNVHFFSQKMMRFHIDCDHNFLCNICGQRFFTSDDLEVHIIKHEIIWEASAFQGNSSL